LITKPKQKRLLIAIEDEGIGETLCGLFEDEGYQVINVKSLGVTLGTINECSPDIVLIGTGKQKGMKIIRQIKDIYPHLPMIVISHDRKAEVVKRMGAITWLIMPISLETVLLAVKKKLR
jgi:two-component system, NtrC family, nitrogen regulation response regulator NtrX